MEHYKTSKLFNDSTVSKLQNYKKMDRSKRFIKWYKNIRFKTSMLFM